MARKNNAKEEHNKPAPEKKVAMPIPKQQQQPAAKGVQGSGGNGAKKGGKK